MSTENNVINRAIRVAGLTNAIAGICVGMAYVLHPHHASPEIVSSSNWFWVHFLFLVSLLGGIFGAIGMFARHSSKTTVAGLIGLVLIVTALTLIFGLNYWELLIIPVVATDAPDFVLLHGSGETAGLVAIVFPASGALFVAGYLLLCSDMIRRQTLAAAANRLTMLGVVVFGAGLSGFFSMLVVKVGAVIFATGLVWLGISLYRSKS